MSAQLKTVIYPVDDLARATATFTALLGAAPTVEADYYVGWELPDVHVGLNPQGHAQGLTGGLPYWHVDDLEATIERLTAAGGQVTTPPTGVGGTRRIAVVRDAEGNDIGLTHDA